VLSDSPLYSPLCFPLRENSKSRISPFEDHLFLFFSVKDDLAFFCDSHFFKNPLPPKRSSSPPLRNYLFSPHSVCLFFLLPRNGMPRDLSRDYPFCPGAAFGERARQQQVQAVVSPKPANFPSQCTTPPYVRRR